jgi:hypothetical protein
MCAALRVAASKLGDQHCGAACVDGELHVERVGGDSDVIPTEVIAPLQVERVGPPARGVVHEDVDCVKTRFGRVEQSGRRGRIGEIGLQGDRFAARCADRIEYVLGTGGAVLSVEIGNAGIRRVLEPKVGDDDTGAARGQRTRSRRTDSVVRTRHERDVVGEIEGGRSRDGRHRGPASYHAVPAPGARVE